MKKGYFLEPKQVLVFNNAKVLIAIVRSLHSAAQLTLCNLHSISFCCTGKYVMSGGFYFRHLNPKILIEVEDLDNLKLEVYDKMCGENREYYTVRQLARMRKHLMKFRQARKNRENL